MLLAGQVREDSEADREVDLGEKKTFDRARISEAYDRVRRFELQIDNDGRWQTVYRGTTVGEDFSAGFDPVTGDRCEQPRLDTARHDRGGVEDEAGRAAGCPAAPVQIPACGIPAPGSSEMLASASRLIVSP